MKSLTSALLPALPALAGIKASASAHTQPVAFDNRSMVPLLSEGDACGYVASHKNESVCGYGLCCSLKSVRRLLPRTTYIQHANLGNNRTHVALTSYRAAQSTVSPSSALAVNYKAISTRSYSHKPHRPARAHRHFCRSAKVRLQSPQIPVPHRLRICPNAHLCHGWLICRAPSWDPCPTEN